MLSALEQEVIHCQKCPRLRAYCTEVAATRRRAYRDQTYWGLPVPSFGDPDARLLVIGLAPGAHGANRTGRMFTGDASGDYLYRAMHAAGFASQPHSTHRGDGLRLHDAWITAPVHCAPPDNKPSREEIRTCSQYLMRELPLLKNVQGVIVLGRLAFSVYLAILKSQGRIRSLTAYPFGHDQLHDDLAPWVLCSFHPSQQNTSTGRLTDEMLCSIFTRACDLLSRASASQGRTARR